MFLTAKLSIFTSFVVESSAIDFLIKVVSSDPITQQQVSKQLTEYVLVNTKYNHLHNSLRYPAYFQKYDSYSMLDVGREDYQMLCNRLSLLKSFLNDIDKLS